MDSEGPWRSWSSDKVLARTGLDVDGELLGELLRLGGLAELGAEEATVMAALNSSSSSTSSSSSEAEEEPQRMICKKCSRIMLWSDYSRGGYKHGWDCDNVDSCGSNHSTMGSHRWFCQRCRIDICKKCAPPDVPCPQDDDTAPPGLPADATAAASPSPVAQSVDDPAASEQNENEQPASIDDSKDLVDVVSEHNATAPSPTESAIPVDPQDSDIFVPDIGSSVAAENTTDVAAEVSTSPNPDAASNSAPLACNSNSDHEGVAQLHPEIDDAANPHVESEAPCLKTGASLADQVTTEDATGNAATASCDPDTTMSQPISSDSKVSVTDATSTMQSPKRYYHTRSARAQEVTQQTITSPKRQRFE